MDSLSVLSLPTMRLSSSSWYEKGEGRQKHLHKGNLLSVFRQIETLSCICFFSQFPSAQNNPYARVTYLGVAYSDPLCNLAIMETENEVIISQEKVGRTSSSHRINPESAIPEV